VAGDSWKRFADSLLLPQGMLASGGRRDPSFPMGASGQKPFIECLVNHNTPLPHVFHKC